MEIMIFTLCNKFFSFTNDFDISGGRVVTFTASGNRSLLIEGRAPFINRGFLIEFVNRGLLIKFVNRGKVRYMH